MFTEEYLKTLAPAERLHLLRDNADATEEDVEFYRELSTEEINVRKDDLSEVSIKLSQLEDRKKEFMEEHKLEVKPLSVFNKRLLEEIKTGQVSQSGTLYHHYNQDSGYCESFDENGTLIKSRRLRPNEKQKSLFRNTGGGQASTGTNG